jgi:hypothetical protein
MNVRYSLRCVLLLSILLLITTSTLQAQITGANKIYTSQFSDLRSKVTTIFNRVIYQGDKKMTTKEEILTLTKLIYRLHDEVGRSNIDALKKGLPLSKILLLIGQGCQAMDFVLSALDNYIDTEDRSFIALAKSGDDLIKSIEKLI